MNNILIYNISLEVTGPIHIGSGVKLERTDYIKNKNTIYVLNPIKLFDGLKSLNLLHTFENDILGQSKGDMTAFVKKNNIAYEDYIKWSDYNYKITDDIKNNTQILTCIKDAYNLPYIPGSSLKGCIRNAVLNSRFMASDKFKDLELSVERGLKEEKSRKQYLKRESKKADSIFYTYNTKSNVNPDISNDIFKGLRISDSKPLKQEDIILCQKIDVSTDGRKRKLPVFRECIKPGTIIDFTLEIDKSIFTLDIDKLILSIKAFYINQKKCFLSKYPQIATDKLKGNLIYLGGGAGFVSKTAVYSLFKDKQKGLKAVSIILDKVDSTNKGKKVGKHLLDPTKYGVSPHTRKCTQYNNTLYDFGLCKIDFKPIG
ncbi:MAG: type III-A CRISPR-associated RAMP protein Csm5 [Lachnospirales bacterium]